MRKTNWFNVLKTGFLLAVQGNIENITRCGLSCDITRYRELHFAANAPKFVEEIAIPN